MTSCVLHIYYIDVLGCTPSLPRILQEVGEQSVGLGETVILECAATGYPTPTITWRGPGRETILPSEAIFLYYRLLDLPVLPPVRFKWPLRQLIQ